MDGRGRRQAAADDERDRRREQDLGGAVLGELLSDRHEAGRARRRPGGGVLRNPIGTPRQLLGQGDRVLAQLGAERDELADRPGGRAGDDGGWGCAPA